MLRRRHHPQAPAAGSAEGGPDEDAPVRQGRYPAGGLHRRPENGPGLGWAGMLRSIPDFMDRDCVSRIDARLHDIGAAERVAIPLAIESGSRAWGFPSPDSDYDCRFMFVRAPD